ncbi:MAG: hypothetical protein QOH41_2331 [Blastocatellia bacterium]|jgi:hypothetical protein|nr:hypothetical protein [Blastocatellia bacterium]
MKKISLAVLILVLAAIAVSGQDHERASLKGLHGVQVYVQLLPGTKDALEKIGVSIGFVVEQTTLRLRKAGIKVVESADEKRFKTWSEGWPQLAVELNYLNRDEANVAFLSVSVHLVQLVILTRTLTRTSQDQAFLATTWESSISTVSGSDTKLYGSAKEMIGNAVDSFINAYLAENPKP